MLWKNNLLLINRVILAAALILNCFTNMASAEQSVTAEVKVEQSKSKPGTLEYQPDSSTHQSSDDLNFWINENLKLSKRINRLEEALNRQTSVIGELKADEKSMDYAQWSSIMLASVALILTVLGIVLALFSFVGYQKVLDSAKKTATEVAGLQVENKIDESTRTELEKLFSKQAMSDTESSEYKKVEPIRAFLLEAVAKVIYREISFDSQSSRSEDDRGGLNEKL